MFRRYFVTLFLFATCCFILMGCNPSKAEVTQYLLPTNETEYAVHIFYTNGDGYALGNELNIFHNSSPALQEGMQMQLWNVEQERIKRWTKVLAIKTFPAYLITNKEGIVFQSEVMEEAKHYLTEKLDISEQTTEDDPTIPTHFSLDINNSIISLSDEDVDLQNIIGEPISEKIEVLPNEADTLKGTFIKTLTYDGLEIIQSSPKDDGKNFSILEMKVTKKNYRTSKGSGIGDNVEAIMNAYPNLKIADDGRTDPNNCAYVINDEQVRYLQFEVKEGLVSEIHVRYVFQ